MDGDDARMADEYFPAMHLVQPCEPAWSAYVPTGQLRQMSTDVASTEREKVPIGQGRHVRALMAPMVSENLPAGQDTHAAALTAAIFDARQTGLARGRCNLVGILALEAILTCCVGCRTSCHGELALGARRTGEGRASADRGRECTHAARLARSLPDGIVECTLWALCTIVERGESRGA